MLRATPASIPTSALRRRLSPSRSAFWPGLGCVPRILDVYAALDGAVTSHYEVTSHPSIFDGIRVPAGQQIAVIRHNARVILSCERVILNFLQRMAGIATTTRKFVDAVEGTHVRILDTRKTAPGLRLIDKYAVRCGGGQNHRLDLSDGVLIKSNHIALAGGAAQALERAVHNRRGRGRLRLKCGRSKNCSRRWNMGRKRFCSTM
jgi:nicotinate-nucleotide pyrophosphorylase (carboxylating)